MNQPNLKIFRSENVENSASDLGTKGGYSELILEGVFDPIRVSAADFIRLLEDAIVSKRNWLEDFADDAMVISKDFYEVLLAYQRLVEQRAA
jgi:hypothetical protein